MNQKLKKKSFVFGIFVLSLIGLYSCSEGDISVGKNFIESSTYTAIIDTFSLELSTIKVDSVLTSSSAVALTGFVDEAESGPITARAYFKMDNSITSLDSKEVFDSLCLVMNYSGYYYGDTLSLFGFKVHLTQNNLEDLSDTYDSFYNVDTLAYDPTPIGTIRYYPEPSSNEEVSVRIDDAFGESLFDSLQNISLSTNSDFDEWLKGIVLVPDTTYNQAVIGYDATIDSIALRMYTHISETETQEVTHDFSITSQDLQFNSITSDTKDLGLSQLTNTREKLKESELNNTAILQGGTGYYTRLDFLGLSSMKALKEQGRIVYATLEVDVKVDSYLYKDLPSSLYLIEADKINQFVGYVSGSDGADVTGVLNESTMLYEHTAVYSFDVTAFLNAIIGNYISN